MVDVVCEPQVDNSAIPYELTAVGGRAEWSSRRKTQKNAQVRHHLSVTYVFGTSRQHRTECTTAMDLKRGLQKPNFK